MQFALQLVAVFWLLIFDSRGYDRGMGPFIAAVLFVCFILGAIGTWVADQCGRSYREGFWLGFILGPFGLILVALLPRESE